MPPRSQRAAVELLHQLSSTARTQRSSRLGRDVCFQCKSRIQLLQLRNSPASRLGDSLSVTGTRAFSTSSALSKKSGKKNKNNDEEATPKGRANQGRDEQVDPYDFSELERGIASVVARLKDALVKAKDARAITPEMIEQLPVEINVKGSDAGKASAHKEKAKVGELASVVSQGMRKVNVFCAEEAVVKPVSAAILASPYSLAPQSPSADNPLLITINVPPVTAETRDHAKAESKKLFDRANNEVREARGVQQKRFRQMELGKLVVPDELRKAHKAMEEVVKKGGEEVKKVHDSAIRALEAK